MTGGRCGRVPCRRRSGSQSVKLPDRIPETRDPGGPKATERSRRDRDGQGGSHFRNPPSRAFFSSRRGNPAGGTRVRVQCPASALERSAREVEGGREVTVSASDLRCPSPPRPVEPRHRASRAGARLPGASGPWSDHDRIDDKTVSPRWPVPRGQPLSGPDRDRTGRILPFARHRRSTPLADELDTEWPSFFDDFDSRPDAAGEGFATFLHALVRVRPPYRLRWSPKDDRDDMVNDFYIACTDRNFSKLRRYRRGGRPFAAWLLVVFDHFLKDRHQKDAARPQEQQFDDGLESMAGELSEQDDREYRLDLEKVAEEVRRCLDQLRSEDQVLLDLWLDEKKPRDVCGILGLPRSANKSAHEMMRSALRRMGACLKSRGVDAMWLEIQRARSAGGPDDGH